MVLVANELIANQLLLGLAAMAALGSVLGFFPVDLPQEQFCSALQLAGHCSAAAEGSSKSYSCIMRSVEGNLLLTSACCL